ncbi:MAG: Lrp/AsnC family transcriptional regulator [Halioglobus sp.]
MDIDRIDRAILSQLQRDNTQTNVDLADKVGLSPPACLKRVKKLRNNGAILADVSILSPDILGIQIQVIFLVEIIDDTPTNFHNFTKRMSAQDTISQCYQVAGESDFVLVGSFGSIEALDVFSENVLRADTSVKKFKTLISKKRSKFTTAVSL